MEGGLQPGAATTRAPNIAFEPACSSGRSLLPQILDLTWASALRDTLAELLAEQSIVIDASAVERMSTPCAQVLLAAGRTAHATRVPFRILNASAVFRAALADLGLQPEFSKWMD
jgi:anti-anti-sigma regulatory factor